MPKRTTHAYTSDNVEGENHEQNLAVYYCKYTGEHVFILDTPLQTLPRRKADGSRIIDTEKVVAKFTLKDGGSKLLRRSDGSLERQYRLKSEKGNLPICYKLDETDNAKFIYVLPNSATTYDVKASGEDAPVPPCIQENGEGIVQIAVELQDRSTRTGIIRINADDIHIQVGGSSSFQEANSELLEFMAKTLGVHASQMALLKGWSNKSKLVMIKGMTDKEVYEKLRSVVAISS